MANLSRLTFAARALISLALICAAGSTIAYFYWINERVPQGRYPLFLFAAPAIVATAVAFGFCTLVMRLLKIP
jgi:hypothetical protein